MSGTPFEIPLASVPQSFAVNLGGTVYNLRLYFCPPLNTWILDVSDVSNNPIVCGIAVVTGTDLLAPYQYLGFPGQLVVWWVAEGQPQAPTLLNLGSDARLYFIPNAS